MDPISLVHCVWLFRNVSLNNIFYLKLHGLARTLYQIKTDVYICDTEDTSLTLRWSVDFEKKDLWINELITRLFCRTSLATLGLSMTLCYVGLKVILAQTVTPPCVIRPAFMGASSSKTFIFWYGRHVKNKTHGFSNTLRHTHLCLINYFAILRQLFLSILASTYCG